MSFDNSNFNSIAMWSFIISTHHQILWGWSNWGGWDR